MQNAGRKLVDERDAEYADAWFMTGVVISSIEGIAGRVRHLLMHYAYMFFPWVMILNKLLRILRTPDKLDHWVDIAGYAQLVIDKLEKDKEHK